MLCNGCTMWTIASGRLSSALLVSASETTNPSSGLYSQWREDQGGGMKMRRIELPGFFSPSEGSRIKEGNDDEEDKTSSRIFSSEVSRRIKTKIITSRIFS